MGKRTASVVAAVIAVGMCVGQSYLWWYALDSHDLATVMAFIVDVFVGAAFWPIHDALTGGDR